MAKENWHWQIKGTAWKGVGIYHVTIIVPSREPLLGKLIIKEGLPFIDIADNGFRDYYKPQDGLFDAVARK